ncbi:MAG: hypothetical protein JNK05_28680 [Myxococcales bacterium]|nr:hypothetical protein [Myxococcales bacterium]
MKPSRLVLLSLLVSCTQDPTGSVASRVTARDPMTLRAQNEVVLDVSSAGEMLVGREIPPPPESDADRLLELRWVTNQGTKAWRFDGDEVLEARFVPRSGAVLVLTREHKLVRVDHPERTQEQGIEIDHDVLGPLSIDSAGRYVVYTRGEMPEYQLVRAEIASARAVAMAPSLVPAWCPTIMPDASEVLVVASPAGTPAFYRVREGREPERWELPSETPLPTGPGAAVVVDRTLVYQSDGAVVSLGLDGALRASLEGRSLPVLSADGTRILLHEAQRDARRLHAIDRATLTSQAPTVRR